MAGSDHHSLFIQIDIGIMYLEEWCKLDPWYISRFDALWHFTH